MQKTEANSVAGSFLQSKARDASIDNIRFFLIFSVVFAHLLEVCAPFRGSELIYQFVYAFHMPAFIFLFGHNIKYSLKRIICRWCIPYIVFQSLYTAFSRWILGNDAGFQYTTPYWLLWYMLACIFCQLLLPLYDTSDKRRQVLALACTYLISLLVGYVESIGYFMSFSRFFVFQPWFLLGYYCRKNGVLESLSAWRDLRITFSTVAAVGIALSVPYLHFSNIANGLLYGSYAYDSCASNIWMRVSVGAIALCWVIFLFLGMKPYINRQLAVISTIGQNSWPVFLLHGFCVKLLPVYWPEALSSPWLVVVTSCAILLLFGNGIAQKAVSFISFSWIEKYSGKKA